MLSVNFNMKLITLIFISLFICACKKSWQQEKETPIKQVPGEVLYEILEYESLIKVDEITSSFSFSLNNEMYSFKVPKEIVSLLNNVDAYQISILKTGWPIDKDYLRWTNSLLSIKLNDNVIIDYTICTIHKMKMDFELKPIVYGLMTKDNSMQEFKNKFFPYAESFYYGGCMQHGASPEQAKVFLCDECIAAKEIYNRTMRK